MKKVDSFRFTDPAVKLIAKAWIGRDLKRSQKEQIPWTPLGKKLSECRVALISSGGIALKGDRPFDQEGERQNPWWGDPSFRVIPKDTRTGDVAFYHLHIDSRPAEEDLNCLLPLERLQALADEGVIGESAPSHHTFMGYILRPRSLLEDHLPAVIEQLKKEQVDAVVLVPA